MDVQKTVCHPVLRLAAALGAAGMPISGTYGANSPKPATGPPPKVEAPGSLTLWGDGHTKKGFTDFAGMELVTRKGELGADGTVKQWKKVTPHGTVHAARAYGMTHITDDGKKLSFETQAVRGISYRFTGAWVHDAPAGTPVLKGKLVKLRNGNTADAADVGFVTEEGD